jgi:hypothetical protein
VPKSAAGFSIPTKNCSVENFFGDRPLSIASYAQSAIAAPEIGSYGSHFNKA